MDTFKYPGRMLDQSNNNWLAVLRNIRKARRVWIRLGKLLRREGMEQQVSAMFYQAVVQVVLVFGSDTWVLLEAMYQKLEGVHVGFLIQGTGQKFKLHRGGT